MAPPYGTGKTRSRKVANKLTDSGLLVSDLDQHLVSSIINLGDYPGYIICDNAPKIIKYSIDVNDSVGLVSGGYKGDNSRVNFTYPSITKEYTVPDMGLNEFQAVRYQIMWTRYYATNSDYSSGLNYQCSGGPITLTVKFPSSGVYRYSEPGYTSGGIKLVWPLESSISGGSSITDTVQGSRSGEAGWYSASYSKYTYEAEINLICSFTLLIYRES